MPFSLLLVITQNPWCSVTQLCLTLCDPMDCSTPSFPVLHHLQELARIHVHWVDVAFQPSHPLSFPSPAAFSLSQHQGFFKWVSFSHQVAKYWSFSTTLVLSMNIQDWFPLVWTGWISLKSKGLSRVVSNTTLQKHQLFSFLYSPTLTSIHDYWKNHNLD